METNSDKNTATLLQLSALTQYFIPFGNFMFPIIIWSSAKDKSEYIDAQGKQAINFQLSLFLYTVILCLIAVPILIMTIFKNVPFQAMINDDLYLNDLSMANITGIAIVAIIAAVVFCFLKVAEFFLVIYASVKAANGETYKYPLSIPFIR
jgi:uncharacterized protein